MHWSCINGFQHFNLPKAHPLLAPVLAILKACYSIWTAACCSVRTARGTQSTAAPSFTTLLKVPYQLALGPLFLSFGTDIVVFLLQRNAVKEIVKYCFFLPNPSSFLIFRSGCRVLKGKFFFYNFTSNIDVYLKGGSWSKVVLFHMNLDNAVETLGIIKNSQIRMNNVRNLIDLDMVARIFVSLSEYTEIQI